MALQENFIKSMSARGLLKQSNHEHELSEHVQDTKRVAYVGFDPTADSLHIGHLLPFMMLSRWQRHGHKAIALMGAGTAMVGDPTGKSSMRQMLTPEVIDSNVAVFKKQVAGLLDFSSPDNGEVLNNADWLCELNYIEFLREYGKHFSVNRMLSAECFKARLESGLSFLEFNYMLLQAFDFLTLYRTKNCTVQLGGDDQWSNMLAGADLIRRTEASSAFCMTNPLLTTTDGKKMGKTENGAVWLDPDRTPPFEYFQFWRNISDDKVAECLAFFTFLEGEELQELQQRSGSEINSSKERLAYEATRLVHGDEEAAKSRERAQSQFSSPGSAAQFKAETRTIAKSSLSDGGIALIDALLESSLVPTRAEAKRLIKSNGLRVNSDIVTSMGLELTENELTTESGVLVQKGKKVFVYLKAE